MMDAEAWCGCTVLYSAPPIPAGIHRNGTGIHRNETGIELESSEMRLENHVYMQIYVYKHLYTNRYNRYNTFFFLLDTLH